MMESTQNLRILYEAFRRYAREIHKKNTPKDPNFLEIGIACAKVRTLHSSPFVQMLTVAD
jgi:farnesyl-diphosphate farnesyltransferase